MKGQENRPRRRRPDGKPASGRPWSTGDLRRHAREIVVKALYEAEMGGLTRNEVEDRIRRKLRRPEERNFALGLAGLTLENLQQIDRIIGRVAENWDPSRMAVMDRNTIRLGAAEILYGDVPAKVAINEAIEVAKRFSTEDSGSFVNGILDRVARIKNEICDNI
jgi:transcription antitermination factor NusB